MTKIYYFFFTILIQILTYYFIGKNWKVQKNATVRNQMPKSLRKNWEQRTKERASQASSKALEKSLKAEKQAVKDVRAHILYFKKRELLLTFYLGQESS